MRIINLLILNLFLISISGLAQKKGIQFVNTQTWSEILQRAQQENKFIFIDCYTTWCGPCRQMSKEIFPLPTVGDFMNNKFISIQVQMDSTLTDNKDIIRWYLDASKIQKKYSVNKYPTFLFLTPSGTLCNRAEGLIDNDQDFLTKAKEALEYPTLLRQYDFGNIDTVVLIKISNQALAIGDTSLASEAFKKWYEIPKNIYTYDNLMFIWFHTNSSKDIAFSLFRDHAKEVDSIMGVGNATQKMRYIIYKEELVPHMAYDDKPNWPNIRFKIAKKYPEYGAKLALEYQFNYYASKKDVPKAEQTLISNAKTLIDTTSLDALNRYAYWVFNYSTNKKLLQMALKWAKQSIEIKRYGYNLDTYASILYRLGKQDEAIIWQSKAVASDPQDSRLPETLIKMKRGEKIGPVK